jgi:hypothetical protein
MSTTILAAALDYHSWGWSIIPTRPGTKIAAGQWKRRQRLRADTEQLKKWFGNGEKYSGLAVIFGEVSGGLGSRDFDDDDAYRRWAVDFPSLANDLPTVKTARGYRVYFRTTPENLVQGRVATGTTDGTGHIDLGDGELRAGVGCYCVLPPSKHPDGPLYRWIRPPEAEIPLIDVPAVFVANFRAKNSILDSNTKSNHLRQPPSSEGQRPLKTGGLAPNVLDTLVTPGSSDTSGVSALSGATGTSGTSGASGLHEERIRDAIKRTLPEKPGNRHRCLFELARELKAIPELANAPLKELRPIVRQWHELALPNIDTKPFDDTWIDFGEGWGKVRHPAGEGPMAEIWKCAQASAPPAAAMQYERPELRLLVSLCQELQRAHGNEPFFLGIAKVAELFDIDISTAGRRLRQLRRDDILELVSEGSRKERRANEYRYIPELDSQE